MVGRWPSSYNTAAPPSLWGGRMSHRRRRPVCTITNTKHVQDNRITVNVVTFGCHRHPSLLLRRRRGAFVVVLIFLFSAFRRFVGSSGVYIIVKPMCCLPTYHILKVDSFVSHKAGLRHLLRPEEWLQLRSALPAAPLLLLFLHRLGRRT